MNEIHLQLCASDEWADTVRQRVVPWVLDGLDLGDDVLEIGPGPGRTTEILQRLVPRLTALEVDEELAAALSRRLGGPNVEVVHGDATEMGLPGGRFSAALSLTMLHHVPSAPLQDRLFAEAARVLRPGGVFAGMDSVDSEEFRALHEGDICVPIDPVGLAGRLEAAGFVDVAVDTNLSATRFRARRPA
ncbi:MAG TPA: class I SAM-dependent methyltransferase [Acidimicrobiales bacterium]|nr:class I SAM-dependent methyltransferase [Acidimicrobiales bacterium]